MKNIINKINESKTGTIESLLPEIQNEADKNAEYHTFNIEDGKKKFKKGFLTFCGPGEFITVTCFNTAKDFTELIGADEDVYDEYDNVKVGECKTIDKGHPDETQILRIW